MPLNCPLWVISGPSASLPGMTDFEGEAAVVA
jgi:hypothetical protein